MKESGVHRWVFDFDGTLAPIVSNRRSARLAPTCAMVLTMLSNSTAFRTAVLSSRELSDLRGRMPIRNIYLGGASGLEWLLPDGSIFMPEPDRLPALASRRLELRASLKEIEAIPGVEVEDKRWSAAIQFRSAPEQEKLLVRQRILELGSRHALTIHDGPEVAELQFLFGMSKRFGLDAFLNLNADAGQAGSLLYAGDDENDLEAMQLVLERGGTAIAVGERIRNPAITTVADPEELGRYVLTLIDRFDASRGL